jgi:hypothetical protein
MFSTEFFADLSSHVQHAGEAAMLAALGQGPGCRAVFVHHDLGPVEGQQLRFRIVEHAAGAGVHHQKPARAVAKDDAVLAVLEQQPVHALALVQPSVDVRIHLLVREHPIDRIGHGFCRHPQKLLIAGPCVNTVGWLHRQGERLTAECGIIRQRHDESALVHTIDLDTAAAVTGRRNRPLNGTSHVQIASQIGRM